MEVKDPVLLNRISEKAPFRANPAVYEIQHGNTRKEQKRSTEEWAESVCRLNKTMIKTEKR